MRVSRIEIVGCLLLLSTWLSGQSIYLFDSLSMSQASIDNLDQINSADLDFSPVIWKDLLVYVTNDREGLDLDAEINEKYFDLKFADENATGTFERDAFFPPVINSAYHEGPCSFTADGNTLFFTRDNLEKSKPIYNAQKVITLQLYSSQLGRQDWTEPVKWEHCTDNYSYAHPSLSPAGDTLIFSSDMKGGYGKMDLYISYKESGRWTEPVNLGELVNSKQNEWFGTYKDGRIFYSTEHDSKSGDLDIWMYDIEESMTMKLPRPINSGYDDFGFNLTASNLGYFSSNRPGGQGKDDLYKLSSSVDFIRESEVEVSNLRCVVVDEQTSSLVSGAELEIGLINDKELVLKTLVSGLNTNGTVTINNDYLSTDTILTSNLKGEIAIETPFPVFVTLKSYNAGYENLSQVFYLTEDSLQTIALKPKRVITASPPPKPATVMIKEQEIRKGSVLVFDNIYYEYNKAEISAGSTAELDELVIAMINNPTLKVQLSAHTDSRGESLYNQLLSDKRADSARRYLIDKGINAARIVSIGFGESRLRNNCEDGVKCTEDEHRFNRRTEVKILDY